MTTVYLDTSVAISESFLKSPFAEAFLKACKILQYTVVIPEIVIDELKGNFPKKLEDKVAALQKSGKDIQRLLDIEIPELSLVDAAEKYTEWLDILTDDYSVIVAPYPAIPLKEIVVESYNSTKPFKESGEGHKDYLIWKSVLTSINSSHLTSPYIFLTNNTKDFCDTDKSGGATLHPDLAKQINDAYKVLKVYTSIKGAFDTELAPNLQGMSIDDIPDLGENDIFSMVGELLLRDLPHRSLYGIEGVQFNDDVSISTVGEHTVDLVNLKKVDDEVVISISGSVEIGMDGFLDKSDYYSRDDDRGNLSVVDGNWNDHVMFVSSSIDTPFNMTVFYSISSGKVTGCEISLTDEIEDEWPYK